MTQLITGPAGKIEIITTEPKTEAPYVAVCCHPHPLHDGTMHNKVVTTTVKAFQKFGIATVRFNFRGVGNSEGKFADAVGECDDLRAVIAWAQQQYPGKQLCLSGFSFGSYIAAKVASEIDVAALISVAPAVTHYNFSTLNTVRAPWLVVMGDDDEVVPFAEVKAFAEHPPAPLTFIEMAGVGHFFHGRLIELRELMENFLAQTLGISKVQT